jgi:heme oxygenase
VEVNDLKNVVDHVMDMVVPQAAGEEPKPVINRLIAAQQKLTKLLRATSLTAAVEYLVWVKSHLPEDDMVKVGEGPDEAYDLKAIKAEVQPAAEKIMYTIDYEGDDDE